MGNWGCEELGKSRLIAVALCVAGALTAPRAQTSGVDCSGTQLGAAEREICSAAELARLNGEIVQATDRLKSSLTGADRNVLVDTESRFVAQRNNCSNDRQSVRGCVERVLRARMNALASALSTPASIRSEITQYTVLDAPFLEKYGDRLVGRRVSVFGCMILDPARVPADRLRGRIRESCEGGVSVQALFTAMDDASASWFDRAMPSSHWAGVVEQRDGRIVLVGVER